MWVLSASQAETVLSLVVPAGGTEPSRLAVPVCLALFGTTADFFAWLDWRRKKPCASSSSTGAAGENLGVFGFGQINTTICLEFIIYWNLVILIYEYITGKSKAFKMLYRILIISIN